jgi:PKD repeat protein
VPNPTFAGNTTTGATVTIPSTGFSDPNQCPLSISATGGCSGSGSSVNCPFGTSTVTLTATNNGVTFTAPVTVRITVSNFKVGVSPSSASVNAGQAASYNVTVAPQLGAFPSAITLGCSSLPALSTCSFSPASVTPGTNAATSMLTLSTTASALAPPRFGVRMKLPPATEAILVGLLLLLLAFFKKTAGSWQSVTGGRQSLARWHLSLPGLLGAQASRPPSDRSLPRRSATDNEPPTTESFPESRILNLERRLRGIAYAACSVLLAFLLLQISCGGGGSSGGSGTMVNPGTPAGTYNINVTGTSSTLVQTAPVTLVVQ